MRMVPSLWMRCCVHACRWCTASVVRNRRQHLLLVATTSGLVVCVQRTVVVGHGAWEVCGVRSVGPGMTMTGQTVHGWSCVQLGRGVFCVQATCCRAHVLTPGVHYDACHVGARVCFDMEVCSCVCMCSGGHAASLLRVSREDYCLACQACVTPCTTAAQCAVRPCGVWQLLSLPGSRCACHSCGVTAVSPFGPLVLPFVNTPMLRLCHACRFASRHPGPVSIPTSRQHCSTRASRGSTWFAAGVCVCVRPEAAVNPCPVTGRAPSGCWCRVDVAFAVDYFILELNLGP